MQTTQCITNMKKLTYILLTVFLLTACSSDDNYPSPNPDPDPTPSDWNGDWNDKNDPNYKPEGYNPIEGEWVAYSLNGKNYTESFFLKFSSDLIMTKSSIKPAEDKDPVFDDAEKYIINDKGFRLKQDNYCRYSLKNNILTVFISPNTWILKPYVHKEWRWEGDWNDPKDPHYVQYKGKYNPIKGKWKLTHIDGRETSLYAEHTFTDTFEWINGTHSTSKYQINDTGIKKIKDNQTYKYKIENNTLNLQLMYTSSKEVLTYKRIQ